MSGILAPRAGAPYTPVADGPPPGADADRDGAARGGARGASRQPAAGAPDGPPPAGRPRARRLRRAALGAGALCALGAIASAGAWGPRALSHLAFFRVRRVEIDGARYAAPGEIVARLGVDTTASVWADLAPLARRVAGHPLVDGARVERRLPGVLRVVVHERVPVARVPGGARGALAVYDAAGAVLPLAPSRVGGVDVPLAASADSALLRALGTLRDGAPRVYARVLEAARAPRPALASAPPTAAGAGPGVAGTAAPNGAAGAAPAAAERGQHDELDFVLAPPPGAGSGAAATAPVLVRAAVDVSAGRFADLGPVEDDLARRGVRAAELDLRFRDQVVARLAGAPDGAAAGATPNASTPRDPFASARQPARPAPRAAAHAPAPAHPPARSPARATAPHPAAPHPAARRRAPDPATRPAGRHAGHAAPRPHAPPRTPRTPHV